MEFDSKRKETMLFVGKWVELEIMLHEISQSHHDKYHMCIFSHMWNSGQKKGDMKFKRVYNHCKRAKRGRRKDKSKSKHMYTLWKWMKPIAFTIH